MFAKIKDKTISFSVKTILNIKFKEYGEMLKLNLDSTNKTIELEVMLKGEKEPLEIKVNQYEIIQENGKYFIHINGLKTSREWINVIAKNYLEDEKFELDSKLAEVLKVLV